jgi:outer membrane protein assembly factor BamD
MAVLLIAGCGSSSRLQYDSPEEAWTKGKEFYDQKKYTRAIEYLQGVFDFGRTHEWAANAQLFLARSYRGNREYLLAANEFTRFTQIYRSDPRVPDAEFELALTYFDRSPVFDLDQTDTERALTQFRLFINRNPDSDRIPEAQQKIRELREKLAHKAFAVARLYERRELYQAAAVSFEAVFDTYYDSPWADDALVGAMRMYLGFARQSIVSKQEERLNKAVTNYDRLVQIFPDSPLIKEAELVYEEVRKELDRFKTNS